MPEVRLGCLGVLEEGGMATIPSRIMKPIAGLPSNNEKMAEKFSGEHNYSKNPSTTTSNIIAVEVLLPTHQYSPVTISGESSQIYSNIQIYI